MPSQCQRSLRQKDRCAKRCSLSTLPNVPANSAEDYCSVVVAVAVVANQAVAVLVAAGAVSSTAVHSGLAAGRIAAMQPPVLRHYYCSAAAAGIPEA